MAFLSDSQHCAENLYLTRYNLINKFLWWLYFQQSCINMYTNHLATTCAKRRNLVIIILYWAVCRQLSAALWWLTSFVLLFMSGITDNASTDLLIFIVLKTKYVPSCKREASQCLTDLKYCVAHTNGPLCFHQIPSEGSSVCTFITLGLHEEEFSIRSGSNKSSLTGEMVH